MWHTQAAAVTGTSHLRDGRPCQDRTAARTDNGVTVVALSDGAGSAAYAEHGAACAAHSACDLFCARFDEFFHAASPMQVRRAALEQLGAALQRRADELGAALPELACTLLAVAVRGDDYLILHVGDGVIGYRRDGRLRTASAPDNGEYANTTVFVTSPGAARSARILRGTQPALEGFVLLSDGCEHALYRKRDRRLAPLLDTLLRRAELLAADAGQAQLESILRGVIARRTGDDCSLALLTRRTADFRRWDDLTQRERAAVLGVTTQNRNKRRRQIRRYAEQYGAGLDPDGSPDTVGR